MGKRNITRRAACLLGLGALASAPAQAWASAVSRNGYTESGDAYEGLVTIHWKTYCYVGGEKATGRLTVGGKERYFWPGDGHMAVSEEADGDMWGADGGLVREGETIVDGKRYYICADGSKFNGWKHLEDGDRWAYFSPALGGAAESGEALVPRNNEEGAEKRWYWFDPETGACAHGWRDMEDGRRVHYDEAEGWMAHGWFSVGGSKYCADPDTGDIARGCTKVDPTRPGKDEFGSIYDFGADGAASWHVPIAADLPGGATGPSAPLPHDMMGDERQRSVYWALSRLGCPYVLHSAPTGFVCDGLTGWSVTNGTEGRVTFLAGVDRQYQDMSWQHKYIREKNGTDTDWSRLRCGDIVFWGDASQIENHGTYGSRHVSMYYGTVDGRRMMIHAGDALHGCCIAGMDDEQAAFGDFIDFGSPYDEPTSECEVWG